MKKSTLRARFPIAFVDRVCLVAWLLLLAIICSIATVPTEAVDTEIGGVKIKIPPPKGFAEISSVSPQLVSMFSEMCPQTNRLLGVFLSEDDIGRVLRDQFPEMRRYMLAQSVTALDSLSFTKYQFAELRKMLREQYDTFFEDKEEYVNSLLDNMENVISKRTGERVGLSIGDIVPLGVESESSTGIAVSQLTKYQLSVLGKPEDHVVVASFVVTFIKGKVIYLYVFSNFADKVDLNWVRKQADAWHRRVLAINQDSLTPWGSSFDSSVRQLLKQRKQKYFTGSHPKAQGLNIIIAYPDSWTAKEGDHPHIVQKFVGDASDGISKMCLLSVHELPEAASWLTSEEIADEMFSPEDLADYVPDSARYITGDRTKIDGECGAWIQYYLESEKAGMRCAMYNLRYMFVYSGKLVSLECGIGGALVGEAEILKELFDSYLPLFQLIANSIVIHNKWEEIASLQSNDVDNSIMTEIWGEYWLLTLIVSAILTWSIGLAPPLLIRFVFLQRPLSKPWAFILVAGFWIFNVILFTSLGSTSRTHGALFLVAWVSYAILRKGYKQYYEPVPPPLPSEKAKQESGGRGMASPEDGA